MHRTDAPDNDAGHFVEPDEQLSILGTEIAAVWLTDLEENVCRAIEAAGLTLVKGTVDAPAGFDQLADAIRGLAGSAVGIGKNLLANGGFELWRRATVAPPSFALADVVAAYTADRWRCVAGAGGVATITRLDNGAGLGVAPASGRFALSWAQSTAGTSPRLEQRVELLEELDGRTVTFSGWVLSGAGSKDVVPYARQSFGAGGSVDVEALGTLFTVVNADGWTHFQATFELSSVEGLTVGPGAYTAFGLEGPSGITFGLAFSGLQVEIGPTATEFALEEKAAQLARCQRYFATSYDQDVPLLTVTEVGALSADESGTTLEGMNRPFVVPMRTTPALVFVSPSTGALGMVERPPGSDAAVSAVLFTSSKALGTPVTPGASSGIAFAHFIADAEL